MTERKHALHIAAVLDIVDEGEGVSFYEGRVDLLVTNWILNAVEQGELGFRRAQLQRLKVKEGPKVSGRFDAKDLAALRQGRDLFGDRYLYVATDGEPETFSNRLADDAIFNRLQEGHSPTAVAEWLRAQAAHVEKHKKLVK